ncbi:MAG: patatin-like phospholipase family protein [Bacteroidales bacterium]|nr:patatin-like phospholipase family protein [Bacteroidales bacterium]
MKKKSVSLVLGSGGARGLAHIGVIKWLEENDYEIKSIAGCSIGSLVGGVYAAGKLNQLEEWMLSINNVDMVTLLDLSWGSSGGLIKGEKIINTLVNLIEDIKIEDLSIPFTAVAVDLVTEKEVWITSGSLFDAIRASISLPLLFTPVKNDNSILVDGGVLNPVPIAPTFKDGTDLTIAVNLGGPLAEKESKPSSEIGAKDGWGKFQKNIKEFIDSYSKTEKKPTAQDWGMYEVANRASDSMQSTIARLKIAAYPPDVEISIAKNACGTLEFDRAEEMIKLGYEKAQLALNLVSEK